MPQRPPGPYPLDGVDMPTWILRFDKRGVCTSPLTREAVVDELRSGSHTDVIVFSHGWNNDFNAAIALYGGFLQRFERTVTTHPPQRPFSPLFVGIMWPSSWLVFDKGPQIAAALAGNADDAAESALLDEMVARIAAADTGGRIERFYTLMETDRLSGAEAREFAAIVTPAFASLDEDENRDGVRSATTDDVVGMLREFERAAAQAEGVTTNIDDWGGVGSAASGGPEAAGVFDSFDPRQAIRLFSVYQMKDRAGRVGYTGVARLLRDVRGATSARVHVVGHSFGCKVLLSAICEPTALGEPVDSLLLLQPAISHLCFAAAVPGTGHPGGYRQALDASRVQPPIYVTYSRNDFPLHDTFHIALRRAADLGEVKIAGETATTAGDPPSRYAALGGYGPRGAEQKLVDPLPGANDPYPAFGDAPIVAFDGSNGLIRGHGDVKSDAAAWALYQLAFRQP